MMPFLYIQNIFISENMHFKNVPDKLQVLYKILYVFCVNSQLGDREESIQKANFYNIEKKCKEK